MALPLKPIENLAAWTASEVQGGSEWTLTLTDAEVEEMLAVAHDRPREAFDGPVSDDEPSTPMPKLTEKSQQIQTQLEDGCGVVRLTGFPVEAVTRATAKTAFWHFCRHVGTPISQSSAGVRLFEVTDAGYADDDRRARGPNTRKKLSFHTDRCDVIGFLCYRQAQAGGENQVVSSVAIFNTMLAERPDLVEVLGRPFLYQRHNVDTANELAYVQQPIFSVFEGHFAANLLRVLIERAYAMPDTPNMSDEQCEALDYLEEVASRESMQIRFTLQPGEMLFLNNFVTLHRRTQFVDHEDPDHKRLLFRIWLSMSNSRPLDPSFRGNYGATEAGALRGGMQAG